MGPLAAAVGVAAVSGLSQAWNAAKASGANTAKLNEIENAFNSIKPPSMRITIDEAGNMDPEYLAERVKPTDFDMSQLSAPVYKILQQYAPKQAQFVAEQAPQVVQDSSQGAQGRQAQMDALKRLQDIGSGATPDYELQDQLFNAQRNADSAAKQRQASLLADAQRRGQGGSGIAALAQMQAAESATDRQAVAESAAAAEAYRNRLAALAQGAQLGGQISAADRSLAGTNAGIINDFNQRMSTNYQNYVNQGANMQNEAQKFNIGQNQGAADKNVASAYDNAKYNQSNINNLKNMQRQQEIDERTRFLGNRQQEYSNEMAKHGKIADVGMASIQNRNNATAQTNTAIQGIGEAGIGALMKSGKSKGGDDDDEKSYSGSYVPTV